MTRTWRRLVALLMSMATADATRLAFAATSEQLVSDPVRTNSARIATLIQRATERSHTFSNLVKTIGDRNGIVYIEEGRAGTGDGPAS